MQTRAPSTGPLRGQTASRSEEIAEVVRPVDSTASEGSPKMYGSSTIYLELAKARHNELMATSRRYQFPKHPEEEPEGSPASAARGFFASILAAVSSLARPRTAPHKAATD